jgi:hypothetical protein
MIIIMAGGVRAPDSAMHDGSAISPFPPMVPRTAAPILRAIFASVVEVDSKSPDT